MLDINQKPDNNKNLFRKSFELFPDLVFLISFDGKYIDYKGNNVTLHIPPKDFIGKKIEEIMPEDIAKQQTKAIRETFETQEMQSFEFSLQLKEKTLYYENRLVYLNKDRLAMYIRDITENKTLQQKLKKSEERFKSIYFDSPIGIELYDSKGKLIDVNRACLDIFGAIDVNSVQGFDLFQDPNVSDDVKSKLRSGETVRFVSIFDFELVKNQNLYGTKKKGQIYIDVLITPLYIGEHEGVSNYLVQVQDITERKNTDEKIQTKSREYSALLEASKAVLKHKDFASSSKAIFNSCTELLGAPAGYIALLTPEKNENLIVFLNPGDYVCTVDSNLPMPIRGMRKEVVESKEAKYNNNFPETDWLQFLPKGHVDLESVLFIPLIIDDDVQGLMGMANKLGGFTDDDVFLASAFAEFISIALQNSQSLESLEKSEQRYKNLNSELEQRVIGRTKELKRSEEKFKILYENAPLGYQSLDYKGNILEVNRAWLEFFGYAKDEVIGKNISDFMDPGYLKVLETNFPKFKEKGEIQGIEYEMIKKDGDHAIVKFDGKISYDEEGYFKQTHCIFQDITERKKAEQKLMESEEKFRMLFNNVNDAIVIVDIEGNVIECNTTSYERLGYTREEFLKMTPMDFDTPEYAVGVLDRIELVIQEGASSYEVEHLRKDGTMIPVEINSIKINFQGKTAVLSVARDVTERKKAEKELRDSEVKYRSIIDNSGSNIFVYDKDGNYVSVNKQAAESFGRKPVDFVHKSLFDIFPSQKEDVAEYIKISQNIIESGIGRQYERTFNIEKGPRTFLINDQAVKDSEGKGIYIVSSSIDITERKSFEQKLKESEEKFRNIAEQSLMGIFIVQDDVIKYANKRMAEINGYSLEEIYSWKPKEHYITLNPESIIFVEEQAKILETGNSDISSQFLLQIIKKSGEKIWVENFSKVINFEGRPANYITFFDITDKVQTEQKLKESEDKYRLLFNNAPIGIGLSTLEGQVIESNSAMGKLTGYTRNEINNLGTHSIYADKEEGINILKRLQEYGTLRDIETKFKRKDGTVFYCSLNLDIIEMNGIKIIQSTLRDITDKKEAELELIKLTNLKSELLRRTSHELKTPLVSIKGFSELLLELHRDKLDDYVISTINEIKQGCLRLESLISDILKTSELESGTIELKKSREDLSFLIRMSVNEVKGFSDLRNQSIELEIPQNLEMNFEKEQIHQVINNMLNNAIKYTPKSGKIRVKSQIQNENVLISVTDNGIGLTKSDIGQLFKQFGKIERFGQGFDVIPDGSGLGLYISKKIVELHGGKIWVESEGKNKGSTFYFTLPIDKN